MFYIFYLLKRWISVKKIQKNKLPEKIIGVLFKCDKPLLISLSFIAQLNSNVHTKTSITINKAKSLFQSIIAYLGYIAGWVMTPGKRQIAGITVINCSRHRSGKVNDLCFTQLIHESLCCMHWCTLLLLMLVKSGSLEVKS